VVDQEFLDKHNIDYIAHDELVYPSKTHDDVYSFAKTQGMLNLSNLKFWQWLTDDKADSYPLDEHPLSPPLTSSNES
jgi:hypothetical protein